MNYIRDNELSKIDETQKALVKTPSNNLIDKVNKFTKSI